MCGDGDLMEGVTSEAASLAGHLGLGRLICLYDDNGISIEGSTDIAFTEDVALRFQAYNWHVQKVADGNDVTAIAAAIEAARAESRKALHHLCSAPTSPTAAPTSRIRPTPTGPPWAKKKSA